MIPIALVAALTASIAHADSVAGTRSELLVERSHDIALTMHYGHAELVVRRTVWNGGERHDQAMFWIDVPEGAVAVGLRTLGELHGRPHWFDGELLEAELAAARYQELTGIGGYYPKDPALLSWRSRWQLALQVFPCAPQAPKTIEYTMVIPTSYEDGRYRVTLPRIGTDTLRATAKLHAASARDQIFVDGLPVGRGDVLELGDQHELALARAAAPALEGALAMVALGDDRALFHYDFEAGREISKLPRKADVVVLVDRSRSIDDETIAAELVAARGYLSHFAAAKLQARAAVVAFDRKPEDLLHGFAPVGEATALLEHTTLAAKNGSHVDAALEHATKLFEDAPAGRARRIVLFTDRATRSAMTVARVQAIAERTGAIVHLADVVPSGENVLERDDADAWSPIAEATGGVSWHLTVDAEGRDLSERSRVLEELARPLRLHALAVRAPGVPDAALDLPETLDEGAAITQLLLTDGPVPHVVVTGELWSEPVRKVILPDD
ncbi:MAG TPA: vWA domain-containing protein, partial [Nannocystaceae bacterium]|nr:vWA domain-containing protein [Nannocystaceae bacterium]